MRNYEQDLKQNGFETVFQCAREKCGAKEGWLGESYLYPLKRQLKQTPARGGKECHKAKSPSTRSPFRRTTTISWRSERTRLAYTSV